MYPQYEHDPQRYKAWKSLDQFQESHQAIRLWSGENYQQENEETSIYICGHPELHGSREVRLSIEIIQSIVEYAA